MLERNRLLVVPGFLPEPVGSPLKVALRITQRVRDDDQTLPLLPIQSQASDLPGLALSTLSGKEEDASVDWPDWCLAHVFFAIVFPMRQLPLQNLEGRAPELALILKRDSVEDGFRA